MANSNDDFNPYDDLEHDEPNLKPEKPVEPKAPTPPVPKPAEPAKKPEVINADAEDEDDYTPASVEEEEFFEDYTPRPTIFAAPKAEDVLADEAPSRQSRRAERQAAKEDERLARSQAREESRRQKAADRAAARQEKKAEQEAAKAERAALTTDSDSDDAESTTKAKLFTPGRAVAACLVGLSVLSGAGFYGLKSAGTSDQAMPAAATETVTATTSETVEKLAEAESSAAPAAQTPEKKPASLTELVEPLCKKDGASSRGGDGKSPEGAIRAFTHAYYVKKSAKDAVKYLDKAMYDTEASLQEGIEYPSNGDAYCLTIKPAEGDNEFEVKRVEYKAGEDGKPKQETEATQLVTTAKQGEAWKIVGINEA